MIPTTLILSFVLAAPPQFPSEPTLYRTDTGWVVLDTLPDGMRLTVVGEWHEIQLLFAALAPDPKPSPIVECTNAAILGCGQGNVCDVTVTSDPNEGCKFHCRDAHGNCPQIVLPQPASPPGTSPTKPPSTPAD